MKLFELFDKYLLLLIFINSFVAFFIDAKSYEKKSDLTMKLYSRVLSVITLIIGIALYISGNIWGGI